MLTNKDIYGEEITSTPNDLPFADLQIGVTLHPGYELMIYNARHFGMIPHIVVRKL